MSDTMLLGVLRQPFESALSTEVARRQYWQRGKQAAAEIERLQDEVERLTVELDAARAEVERLRANGQGMVDSSRPKGREVGRFGLDGHYLDYEALKPTRPSDEDIWREAFITMLPSYPWEKAAKQSDGVLAEYRKRWPR